MRLFSVFALVALAATAVVTAQFDGDRAPNYDDVVAHLNLTESQLSCLEANQTAFRDAAAPSAEELRGLQLQLRQATRDGADTTAIQADIDAVRATIASTRTTYISSAQGCLDTAQQASIGDLIAAETLMNEVRQGVGLLLLESTEERSSGLPGRGRGRGGRGPGGR